MTVYTGDPEQVDYLEELAPIVQEEAPKFTGRSVYPAEAPAIKRWRWSWQEASEDDKNGLKLLWSNTGGGAGIFQWDPGDGQRDVRFVPGSLSIRSVNRYTFAMQVVVEAVRNWE